LKEKAVSEDEKPEAPELFELGDDDELAPPSLCIPLGSRRAPREVST